MAVEHPTRLATLHRLAGVTRVDAVAALLKDDVRGPADEGDVGGERLTIGGVPAIWFWVQRADEMPPKTLYPMSAASLAQVMRQMDALGIPVEVVPIPLRTQRRTRAA